MDTSHMPYIGLITEYQKEYLDYTGRGCVPPYWQRFPAGFSTKDISAYQAKEYEQGDGLLPAFRGEATSRAAYQPQPPMSQLPSCKPPVEGSRPPMFLMEGSLEKESVNKSTYKPLPLDLARPVLTHRLLREQNADDRRPLQRDIRQNPSSTYGQDYCAEKTKPRSICLATKHQDTLGRGDGPTIDSIHEDTTRTGPCCVKIENLHSDLHSYITSLLFRTTTGSTYQPPSFFGGTQCHLPKNPLEKSCSANDILSKPCHIHKNREVKNYQIADANLQK